MKNVLQHEAVERLSDALQGRTGSVDCFVVLGSGLGDFVERVAHAERIPFDTLADMPASRVPGHAGAFHVGTIAGVRVLVQAGRVHRYEGWSSFEVTRSVRAVARTGARACLLTNAAGGLRSEWRPGTLMAIRDHVDLQGSALFPGEGGSGCPYSPESRARIVQAASSINVELVEGVYAGGLGPAYETPAEIRMLRTFGADAVGMSTVAEATAAHIAGMSVGAISCITNYAAGLSAEPLSHDEVIAAGTEAAPRIGALLEAAIIRGSRSRH